MAKITWDQVKESLEDGHIAWSKFFDERQLKEIKFDELYAEKFAHGTDGHNARLIIAKMAELLDLISQSITITLVDE